MPSEVRNNGKCLVGMGVCYGCGKSGHQVKDFPTRTTKGREDKQTLASGSSFNIPKKNRFDDLQSRGDQESFLHIETYMLQVCSINDYVLLDSDTTFSFVEPLVAMKLEMLQI